MLLANLASQIVREGDRREQAVALAEALAGGQLLAELNSPAYAIAGPVPHLVRRAGRRAPLYDEGLADAARGGRSRASRSDRRSRSGVAFRLGALAEAEADARMARSATRTRGRRPRAWATASLADVLLERGEIAEAAALLDDLPMSSDHVESGYVLHPAQ